VTFAGTQGSGRSASRVKYLPMDDAQLLRYSRHILLDELGPDAQQKFASARVLIVGMVG